MNQLYKACRRRARGQRASGSVRGEGAGPSRGHHRRAYHPGGPGSGRRLQHTSPRMPKCTRASSRPPSTRAPHPACTWLHSPRARPPAPAPAASCSPPPPPWPQSRHGSAGGAFAWAQCICVTAVISETSCLAPRPGRNSRRGRAAVHIGWRSRGPLCCTGGRCPPTNTCHQHAQRQHGAAGSLEPACAGRRQPYLAVHEEALPARTVLAAVQVRCLQGHLHALRGSKQRGGGRAGHTGEARHAC